MWNRPYEMMGGWDWWGWFWPFHFIIPLLFLALFITVVVLIVRYAGGWSDHLSRSERRSAGLEALDERYARGEINRDEYLQKRRDILG
jgi:putative membrane protein